MVYWADVGDFSALSARLLREVAPAERARVGRFRKSEDALRYLVGRRLLGYVLDGRARNLGGEVRIEPGPFGKPRCPGGPSFNLSDAGRLVVCAVVPDGEVGVDVEEIRDQGDLAGVAARHFSRSEHGVLSLCSGRQWLAGFFRLWTVKEAILKAHGIGLGHPLDAVEVGAEAMEGRSVIRTDDASIRNFAWRCLSAPLRGYAMAVAVEGKLDAVTMERYRP